jgi:hypothetical protein
MTKYLLRVVAWLLFAVGGAAFWFGGRVIDGLTNTGRTTAELAGIGLALICGALGALARDHAKRAGAGDGHRR